jgi:Tfp pilus assembly pilus retraction ATPase PilT
VSYSLPGSNRFRVNIFMQRGTCAVVMRVIPGKVPDFESLNLPFELGKIVGLRNGIVLVTGPTGSGKSSTLAAIIDKINKEQSITCSPSKIPSSSCTRTKTASCISASCTPIRPASRSP